MNNQEIKEKLKIRESRAELRIKTLTSKNYERELKDKEGKTDVEKLNILKEILEASYLRTEPVANIENSPIFVPILELEKETKLVKDKMFEIINRL